MDAGVAPEGTAKSVLTGVAASSLSPEVAAEVGRRLKWGAKMVALPTEKKDAPPRQKCETCGVVVVGFDVSHGCTKEDILRQLRPSSMHETLPTKVRFSGRYRLCLWRDAEGMYRIAEELTDEAGAVVVFNVLDQPESWNYVGAKMLDLVVEKFTP